LQQQNPEVRERAAKEWCAWEDALMMTEASSVANPNYNDPAFRMAFARIVTHYFHHRAFLADGELLKNAGALRGIPSTLVHGQFDLCAPLETAYELWRAWPQSDLRVVRAGHSSNAAAMINAVVAATDAFVRA
jgi:proline iminopeptidase